MGKFAPLSALALGIFLIPTLRADVIVLKNGERVEGQVISQDESEIAVQRKLGADLQYVQRIRRQDIASIEAAPVAAPAASAFNVSPTTMPQAQLPQPIRDKTAFVEGIIKKWQAGNVALAGADATRLIAVSKPEELDELSEGVQQALKMSLAELTAQAHFRTATAKGRNHAIRLSGVTTYELSALIPLLIKEYDVALKQEIKPRPEPLRGRRAATPGAAEPAAESQPAANAASQPVSADPNALTIANWIDRPNELNLTRPEALAFLGHVQYTMSLVQERLRLDPEVRRDKTLRNSLTLKRMQLAQLLRVAAKISSGSAVTAGQRPPAPAARQSTLVPQPAEPKTTERVELKRGIREQLQQHQQDQLDQAK